jgi:hypothetical protein
MNKSRLLFSGAIGAALLSACGGGGSSPLTPTPPDNTSPATVKFLIQVPASGPAVGTHQVKPDFVAVSGAQSVTITLTMLNGSAVSNPPVVQNLAANASNCSTSSGTLTCTVSMQVPAGSDTFTVVMYPQPDAKGTALATGTLAVSAAAGQTVNAPATLTGTVASVQLSLPSSIVPEGVATAIPVTLVAKDANGNAIVGSYLNPITLTDTDASKATSLSSTTVSDSTAASALTLNYNGGAITQAATISASAQNVTPVSVTFKPNSAYPAVNGSTLTYGTSENGIGGGGIFASPPVLIGNPYLGTMKVTITTNVDFNGQHGLTDFHIQTSPSPLPAATSDEYYAWNAGTSSASLLFVGETSWQPSQMNGAAPTDGINDAITCQAPYAPVWIVPFPQSWDGLTGTGPCTEHRTIQNTNSGFVDIDIYDRTINADGTYTSREGTSQNGSPENVTDVRTMNADGTGTQSVTWGVMSGMQWSTPSAIIVMQTPAPSSSTIPYLITNFPGPIPSPGSTATPAPTPTTMPNWYAMSGVPNGVPISPLTTTAYANKGIVAGLPAACDVPLSVVGASVPITEIDETHRELDPFLHYQVDTTQYYLAAGIGTVCIQQQSLSNGPGSIYLMPPFTPGGSYDTFTAYLTASTLQTALAASRRIQSVMPVAQSGLFALVRAHHHSFISQKDMRR